MNSGLQSESAKGVAELDPVAEFKQGVKFLQNGYPEKALVCLRRAYEYEMHNPYYQSFLGLSIAQAQRKWDQAVELCQIAIQHKRTEVQFHLNLADVYASAGRRELALDTLDLALELLGDDERLRRARSKVEKRRRPVLPFLTRQHLLNRQLGKFRHHAMKRLFKENP